MIIKDLKKNPEKMMNIVPSPKNYNKRLSKHIFGQNQHRFKTIADDNVAKRKNNANSIRP